jgi:hypothetical protein
VNEARRGDDLVCRIAVKIETSQSADDFQR